MCTRCTGLRTQIQLNPWRNPLDQAPRPLERRKGFAGSRPSNILNCLPSRPYMLCPPRFRAVLGEVRNAWIQKPGWVRLKSDIPKHVKSIVAERSQ